MSLLADLEAAAIARDEATDWRRMQVDSLAERENPTLLREVKRAYISPASVTIRDRWMRKTLGCRVTPGEKARIYLRQAMTQAAEATGRGMLAKRIPWRRDALALTDRRQGYWFGGEVAGPFVIVDLDRAYCTIYGRLTLDMTYRPDCDPPLIGLGRIAFGDDPEWRAAREENHAAWGCLLRPYITEWRCGEPVDDKVVNRFFAPDLSAFVLDVVHSIAVEALAAGALSWSVDGGLFRPDAGRAFVGHVASRWGLPASIRAEGPGHLWGPNCWRVGGLMTELVRQGKAAPQRPGDSLRRLPASVVDRLAGTLRGRTNRAG